MRWLVRFGYDGRSFYGWARQPGRRTVEGTVRAGLLRHRRGGGGELLGLEVASRTDRGVSARANVLSVESDLGGPPLLRQLNGISPELFFTAAAPVPDGFRLRKAARRVYRYFEPGGADALPAWRRAAELFPGTIDVRSYGRGVPSDRPTWRTIESLEVERVPGGLRVEVRAPSFVWGMVRKIVGALREHAAGRLSLARLESSLKGKERLTLPIAEPEGLVLWDVEYPLDWVHRWSGPTRHQEAAWAALRGELWTRRNVLDAILPGPP